MGDILGPEFFPAISWVASGWVALGASLPTNPDLIPIRKSSPWAKTRNPVRLPKNYYKRSRRSKRYVLHQLLVSWDKMMVVVQWLLGTGYF